MEPVVAVGANYPVFASLGATMVEKLERGLYRSLVLAALLVGLCQASQAQEAPGAVPSTTFTGGAATLFQNVRIFDGKSAALSAPSNVLVRGNTIERISASPITVDTNDNVRVIVAEGRVLMPGLIDAHWHAFMAATPQPLLLTADPSYPVNLGMACPKGWEALTPLGASDRVTSPLLRNKATGRLESVTWEQAIGAFVENLQGVQRRHGPRSISFLSTGQIVMEEMALLGALAKFGLGMLHVPQRLTARE